MTLTRTNLTLLWVLPVIEDLYKFGKITIRWIALFTLRVQPTPDIVFCSGAVREL